MARPATLSRPEVLAPAGDLVSIQAAIAAGADAVYFGLSEGFNARAKTKGVSASELKAVVQRCHEAGTRAYLTLNTLLFEDELAPLSELLIEVAAAGVDALIVQDPAVALIAHAVAPRLEVHASTQMTISSPEAAQFAASLGVTRVVVPRELSVSEIQRFAAQSPVELEVFVHGALCMSWSGQCLTSEAWGGRSANRGQCAQSCRMPYELVVDGEVRPLGDVQYLLSPSDLAGFRALESLQSAGVASLKIEGRYKGPAYTYQTVKAYQRWLDVLERGEQSTEVAEGELQRELTDLALIYSRGFSDGFLGGSDHQQLVEGRFPKHRGVCLGRVMKVEGQKVWVQATGDERVISGGQALEVVARAQGHSQSHSQTRSQTRSQRALEMRGGSTGRSDPLPLLGATEGSARPALASLSPRPGMGVVFDAGHPEGEEAGGRLYEVAQRGPQRWELTFASGAVLSSVQEGDRVWVNSAPSLVKESERAALQVPFGRLPITLEVGGALGLPLTARATLRPRHREALYQVSLETALTLTTARGEGLNEGLLHAKLGAFGQTPFTLHEMRCALPSGLHLPVSALKQLRRSLVEALLKALERDQGHPVQSHTPLEVVRADLSAVEPRSSLVEGLSPSPVLLPLCRTEEQLEAVIASGLKEVELDWMEFIGLKRAVERARSFGLKVHIATVRVQKPGEQGYDQRIESLRPDGVLIRHWGALTHFAQLRANLEERGQGHPELHGDFSLNLTNSLSARHVLGMGLDSVTASHDLDVHQLKALMAQLPGDRLTVTLHHHIPTFHTEHCVYAHLLSRGADFRSCGRPCEAHRVALRDHKGQEHPVIVDVECRNTVFNAAAQSALSLVEDLKSRGVGRLRVEFVWESRSQVSAVLEGYQGLISGVLSELEVRRLVGAHEQFGLSSGTMTLYEKPLRSHPS